MNQRATRMKWGQRALLLVLAMIAAPVLATNVTQWRNNRDGIYNETGLLKSWPEGGPTMIWSVQNAGAGYSSPIIVDERLYITGVENRREFVSCYDLTGKQLWRTEYSDAWGSTYPEARTTPTYVNGVLYMIGGGGSAAAVNAGNGELIWSKDVFAKYQGSPGRWGIAESPLVYDGRMIITTGGPQTTMIALDTKDGSLAWKSISLNEDTAYVSPLMINHNGVRQIVGVTSHSIIGVNPENGTIVWRVNYNAIAFENNANKSRWTINCNTPVFKDGRIFVTSGYDHAGVMLQLNDDASGIQLVWKTDELDTHHGHVVLVDGYLYGSNWLNNRTGNWTCIDWKTGEKKYETEWHSKGSIIAADGMLYLYEERQGHIGIARATPEGLDVTGSLQINMGSQSHWSHPLISNKVLYVRRGEALMAFDIAAKPEVESADEKAAD